MCHTRARLNPMHDCISVNVLSGTVCCCHVQDHAMQTIMQQSKLNLQ